MSVRAGAFLVELSTPQKRASFTAERVVVDLAVPRKTSTFQIIPPKD